MGLRSSKLRNQNVSSFASSHFSVNPLLSSLIECEPYMDSCTIVNRSSSFCTFDRISKCWRSKTFRGDLPVFIWWKCTTRARQQNCCPEWVTVEIFWVLMLQGLTVCCRPDPFSIGQAVCNPQSKQVSRHHNVLMLHLFQGKQRNN